VSELLKLKKLAMAVGLGSATFGIAAEQLVELEKMVISAAGFEQKITDAPASVTVVSRQELESKPFAGLADALRDIEGIDVGSNMDKNGNISITMRGLPPEYTLVLFNGRRQSDIGDIGPNNFGNSQFMYMPPLSAIERIEVVRGPMSTLYGADAIGGVINIITRKVAKEWGGSISTGATIQEDSQFGDDKKVDLYLSGPLVENLLGVAVRASGYDRDESEPGYSAGRLPLPDGGFFEDSGNFGDKKVVAARNWNGGITFNLTPFENHDFTFEYDIAKQRYDNTEGQTGTLDSIESLWRQGSGAQAGIIQPRVGYAEYQRVEREQFVLSHSGRWSFGNTETSLTRSTSTNFGRSLPLTVQERGELQDIWDQAKLDQGVDGNRAPALTPELQALVGGLFLPRERRELEISNWIFDTKLDMSIGNHLLAVGGQVFHAEMEDGVFGMFGDGFRDGTVQDHEQWALFVEDNWDILEDLTLTLGARYDDHNIFGGQVSPRGYLTYRATPAWTFKGGVSTGYKTPKPNDLFPGITGFGGQGVSPMVGTPDLDPETSVNYEVAAYYDGPNGHGFNVTLFRNDFEDKISRTDNAPNCYDTSGTQVLSGNCVDIGPGWAELGYTTFTQYQNVDKATTTGVEIAGRTRLTDTLTLKGNYTYTDSEQRSGPDKGLPLVNTPEHMANATLSWQALDRLSLSLIAELRDERYRGVAAASGPQQETKKLYYKDYAIYHLGARYEFSNQLSFNARVNNLLDEDLSGRSCDLTVAGDTYTCANDYNVTEKARSFWLSADYRF